MVRDPSIAVRSCVADVLTAVLKHDRELAIRLFEQLCDTEDALLKTHYVERFLFYALQTHFEKLRPIVERMIVSLEPRWRLLVPVRPAWRRCSWKKRARWLIVASQAQRVSRWARRKSMPQIFVPQLSFGL